MHKPLPLDSAEDIGTPDFDRDFMVGRSLVAICPNNQGFSEPLVIARCQAAEGILGSWGNRVISNEIFGITYEL